MRTIFNLMGGTCILLASSTCRSSAPSHADAPTGLPATLLSGRPPEAPATTKYRMRSHDAHANAMRDAFVRGDLDAAKYEAGQLIEIPDDPNADSAWLERLDAMKSAVMDVMLAPNADAAGLDIALVAQRCGECHAALHVPALLVGAPPGWGPTARIRMARHQWAAARLWDALISPSDQAWSSGARVLTDAPLEPERFTPGRSPAPVVSDLARSVHDLGQSAVDTADSGHRVEIYGSLLTTCARCHAGLGGGPPSTH